MKTLFFILLVCPIVCVSQVGINTDTPNQTLDVNGKLEVGDDATLATEGAIRYNSSEQDFEGYNGSQWSSFTTSRGMLPSGAEPYYGFVTITAGGSAGTFSLRPMATNTSTITTIPANKFFIVTGTGFRTTTSSGAVPATNYTVRINGSNDSNNEVVWLQGRFEDGLQTSFSNGFAPLIILSSGQSLQAFHPSFVDSYTSLNVYVRGWLVDDLDY